jgi:hypothetical protein
MSFKKWVTAKTNLSKLHDTSICENCGIKIKDHWKRVGGNWILATPCASPMPKPIQLPDVVVKDWHNQRRGVHGYLQDCRNGHLIKWGRTDLNYETKKNEETWECINCGKRFIHYKKFGKVKP